ncbi:MAG: UvrB/UvrC motif-containing protein [Chthoniobacterales bacterium]
MLCNLCNINEASVFLTQIVNGKMKKVNFCEPCSKKKTLSDSVGFSFPDLLLGLTTSQEVEEEFETISLVTCPTCGFSQVDFKKTGRLGCHLCYAVFEKHLSIMLRNMHGSVVHTGKVPSLFAALRDKKALLQTLQNTLAAAIKEEQYEKAASLRDEINEFNKHFYPIAEANTTSMVQKLLPFKN